MNVDTERNYTAHIKVIELNRVRAIDGGVWSMEYTHVWRYLFDQRDQKYTNKPIIKTVWAMGMSMSICECNTTTSKWLKHMKLRSLLLLVRLPISAVVRLRMWVWTLCIRLLTENYIRCNTHVERNQTLSTIALLCVFHYRSENVSMTWTANRVNHIPRIKFFITSTNLHM